MDLAPRLQRLAAKLSANGFDVRPLTVGPPAPAPAIGDLEETLGCDLPPAFRRLLLTVSSDVEFRWFLPKERSFDPPFRNNFCGDLHWSLENTHQSELARRGWVGACFSDPDDSYDRIWHDKLAFFDVGNGDFLALDSGGSNPDRVLYLSHDDGEGHGYVLAEDVFDLLERWIPLACAGGEDWQWLPFTNDSITGLQSDGALADHWRRVLGI